MSAKKNEAGHVKACHTSLYIKFELSVLSTEWGVNVDMRPINRYPSKHDLLISIYHFKREIKIVLSLKPIQSEALDAVLLYVRKQLNPFLIRWHPLFFTPHGKPIYKKVSQSDLRDFDQDLENLRDAHITTSKVLKHFRDGDG